MVDNVNLLAEDPAQGVHQRAPQRFARGHQQAQGRHRQWLAAALFDDRFKEGRRDAEDGADVHLFEQRGYLLRVARGLGADQADGGADRQRRKDVAHRRVERERRHLQHAVAGAQAVLALDKAQVVDHAAVLQHHALGLAGRTGRVDDIGEAVGRGRAWWTAGGVGGDGGGSAVDAQHLSRRQVGSQRAIGQQHADLGLVEHVGQARGRIVGVERHIGAACLHDGQQASYHVEAAFEADADQPVRTHAHALQVARQLVGALFKRAITHAGAAEGQGAGVGCGLGLAFE